MDDRENQGDELVSEHSDEGRQNDLGPTTAIGRRLKAYYDDVAGEPVPDRFLSLLDALDAAASKERPRD
ncbi:NepR family anti-sigma factor [Aureimonas mangrovi]|uniref:NepR family anti-sigma factor n=1 Tax=Aureimonas mangrovi TaxID=2758041 RepID=UPI00163D9BB9|nr:NepR family anti-sigma factor [Aureimonas mangrovi]